MGYIPYFLFGNTPFLQGIISLVIVFSLSGLALLLGRDYLRSKKFWR